MSMSAYGDEFGRLIRRAQGLLERAESERKIGYTLSARQTAEQARLFSRPATANTSPWYSSLQRAER
ncbi:hypothetical protein FGG20_gp197 [Mycobacterium phage Baka]|uniref:Uncharacterized protein n=1 Tax=Mycobacterium phage Baka TaxID=2902882 RepID=G1D0J3_9CAUD|nr:hypothetical protein FGG20_gp197 [Mycobacterium phage Baka]AEK08288.1 hypothetical protein PBI_BAKA_236 [Mycobacterium phage Baka]